MTKHQPIASLVPAGKAFAAPGHSTPVVETERHDGWTPARQAAFLRELAATHNVTAAAQAVGMSRQSAYKLRARLRGQPFDKGWEAAFVQRFDVLAEAALDRALNGVEVPHYHKGELIGTSRRFDERLTLGLLAMRSHFVRRPEWTDHPAYAYEPDEVRELADRVEHGPESWLEDADAELELRYEDDGEAGAE